MLWLLYLPAPTGCWLPCPRRAVDLSAALCPHRHTGRWNVASCPSCWPSWTGWSRGHMWLWWQPPTDPTASTQRCGDSVTATAFPSLCVTHLVTAHASGATEGLSRNSCWTFAMCYINCWLVSSSLLEITFQACSLWCRFLCHVRWECAEIK